MVEKNHKINCIYAWIKRNSHWIGFIILMIVLVYAFIHMLIEPKSVIYDIVMIVFMLLFVIGLVYAFIKETDDLQNIQLFRLEHLMVIVGTWVTYSLVHFLDAPVVIASCIVGLLAHFLIRKYEVALYCGSFAGMVSVALFGFLEVAVLSIVCALIYALSKPVFKGYGGKLGTIAFMSSLIVHSIFHDNFIIINSEMHLVWIMLTSVLGVLTTFFTQHYLKQSAVMASALMSLIYAIVFVYIFPRHIDYVIVFFSASFIGMSSKEKLPNLRCVIIAGLVLGVIIDIFIELFHGLGGKLGLMAMMSMIITTAISSVVNKVIKKEGKKTHET